MRLTAGPLSEQLRDAGYRCERNTLRVLQARHADFPRGEKQGATGAYAWDRQAVFEWFEKNREIPS